MNEKNFCENAVFFLISKMNGIALIYSGQIEMKNIYNEIQYSIDCKQTQVERMKTEPMKSIIFE